MCPELHSTPKPRATLRVYRNLGFKATLRFESGGLTCEVKLAPRFASVLLALLVARLVDQRSDPEDDKLGCRTLVNIGKRYYAAMPGSYGAISHVTLSRYKRDLTRKIRAAWDRMPQSFRDSFEAPPIVENKEYGDGYCLALDLIVQGFDPVPLVERFMQES